MATTNGTKTVVGTGSVTAAPTVKYTTLDTYRDLQYELNRMAGLLTVDDRPLHSAQYAANYWASTTSRDLLAALNVKAGITVPKNFLGLDAVCNLIASTSNLDAVAALRTMDTPT